MEDKENKKINIDWDWLLIAGVMIVTVLRAGFVISRTEQKDIEPIGYLAACVVDGATLRFAYLWRRSQLIAHGTSSKRKKESKVRNFWQWLALPHFKLHISTSKIRILTFLTCAAWSGGVQYAYMLRQGASDLEALLLSFIWPILIVALAVNEGAQSVIRNRKKIHKPAQEVIEEKPAGNGHAQKPMNKKEFALMQYSELRNFRQAADIAQVPEATLRYWVKKENK